MPETLPLRLLEHRPLGPDLAHLVFAHADGTALPPHRAGQFAQFWFARQGEALRRSYSIATPPQAAPSQHWEFAVARHPGGLGSEHLHGLREGETIGASGPFGRFGIGPNDRAPRYLLIATGTGVAPYRALLPELLQRARTEPARVLLIAGARSLEALPYHDAFADCARTHPELDYRVCLSRQSPPATLPGALPGRVQAALEQLAPQPQDLALLCGHPAMVDDCFERLRQAGLAPARIRRERFVS